MHEPNDDAKYTYIFFIVDKKFYFLSTLYIYIYLLYFHELNSTNRASLFFFTGDFDSEHPLHFVLGNERHLSQLLQLQPRLFHPVPAHRCPLCKHELYRVFAHRPRRGTQEAAGVHKVSPVVHALSVWIDGRYQRRAAL